MYSRRTFFGVATVAGLPVAAEAAAALSQAPDVSAGAPSGIAPEGPSNDHTVFDLSTAADPYQLFDRWQKEAKTAADPNAVAMTLATADADGMPDARMMLLKGISAGAFLFTSFKRSDKGRELGGNPKAALLFYWTTLGRQVRVRGTVTQLSPAAADAAWQRRGARPYKLRDRAWRQSTVFTQADELERRLAETERRFPGEVPRPDWTGYLVDPVSIEFFLPHPKTGLHERLRFVRRTPARSWTAERLVP